MIGGEGGIRTHVPVTRQAAFEAAPLRPLRYLSALTGSGRNRRPGGRALLAHAAGGRSAAGLEETLQNVAALVREDALGSPRRDGSAPDDSRPGSPMRRRPPSVRSAVYQRADPCVDNRSHAHQTRLDGDIQPDTRQPVVAHRPRRFAQRQNFRVRRRVLRSYRPIEPAPDHHAVRHDHGANRHLARGRRQRRLRKRLAHERDVNASSTDPVMTRTVA